MSTGNILISSAGRRVSLLNAFKKEIERMKLSSKVIAADANPELSTAAQFADDYFKTPRVDNDNYISVLLKKCKEYQISIIIPTIDTELEVLSANRRLFAENEIEIIISDFNFVSKTTNKIKTSQFFEVNKIKSPVLYHKTNYKLPVFIKPIYGSRSLNNYIIKKEDEFKKEHFDDKDLLFFEYLDHDHYDEFTCDLYYGKDHYLKSVVPRKRILVLAGEVSTGLTKKNELVQFVKEKLNFIDGARGCLNIQFFLHKENKYIEAIEINSRFGGGYPLSYHAGANYPKMILEEYFFNKELVYDESWKDNTLMLRYNDEVIINNFKEES
ncbi:MAG: ATP-grasp domain-containing protein [bacterium]